jgi:hypothetical protein
MCRAKLKIDLKVTGRTLQVVWRSQIFSLLLIAGFAIWMSGETAGAERGFVKSLIEIRRDNVVIQNWDLSCGAAALATILNYQHGDAISEREIATDLIKRPEYIDDPELLQARQGFSLLDLKQYVEERGYEGIGYGGMDMDNLIESVPIMVPVDLHGYNHFVILRGVLGNRVLLADPAYGNRTMSTARFADAWIEYPKFGHVGFVVRRRDGLFPPNQLESHPSDFVMLR